MTRLLYPAAIGLGGRIRTDELRLPRAAGTAKLPHTQMGYGSRSTIVRHDLPTKNRCRCSRAYVHGSVWLRACNLTGAIGLRRHCQGRPLAALHAGIQRGRSEPCQPDQSRAPLCDHGAIGSWFGYGGSKRLRSAAQRRGLSIRRSGGVEPKRAGSSYSLSWGSPAQPPRRRRSPTVRGRRRGGVCEPLHILRVVVA